jgi:YhcH/YjgK/YiaL family protein
MLNCFTSLSAILLLSILMGCTSNHRTENPENWSEEQTTKWFDQKEWLGKTDLQPDASIDKKELAIQYHRNKARWDKAFSFLKEKEQSVLEVGDHEIEGKDVFVKASEYNSKNHQDAHYEAHTYYTDIHYVVSGTEYIGLAGLEDGTIRTPYEKERDITFYDVKRGRNLLAKPGTFFIFFPKDAHCPGMKVNENVPIKKIVIKVRN